MSYCCKLYQRTDLVWKRWWNKYLGGSTPTSSKSYRYQYRHVLFSSSFSLKRNKTCRISKSITAIIDLLNVWLPNLSLTSDAADIPAIPRCLLFFTRHLHQLSYYGLNKIMMASILCRISHTDRGSQVHRYSEHTSEFYVYRNSSRQPYRSWPIIFLVSDMRTRAKLYIRTHRGIAVAVRKIIERPCFTELLRITLNMSWKFTKLRVSKTRSGFRKIL